MGFNFNFSMGLRGGKVIYIMQGNVQWRFHLGVSWQESVVVGPTQLPLLSSFATRQSMVPNKLQIFFQAFAIRACWTVGEWFFSAYAPQNEGTWSAEDLFKQLWLKYKREPYGWGSTFDTHLLKGEDNEQIYFFKSIKNVFLYIHITN